MSDNPELADSYRLNLVVDNIFVIEEACDCMWSSSDDLCGNCYDGWEAVGSVDLNPLLTSLAVAGGLCMAYWRGWFGRSCEATPGSFTHLEYWSPGCGWELGAER